ncbi:jg11917 [Pararge aegeria aegeria]|uniref:Jg11917 protein n=1 Tax=Pararge aegeria aegeria TaxID=348720 RepID=A0A8S4R014_9NEOP|nr:jg11917 [Pararge aegeria aegeria]
MDLKRTLPSLAQFCLCCLNTDCTLYPEDKYNLGEAYRKLIGNTFALRVKLKLSSSSSSACGSGSSGPWCHVDRLRSIVTPLSRSPSKRWSPSGKAALSLLEEI